MNLDKDFWNDKYLANQIGWDIGSPSTPLKEYIDQLTDKTLKIFIPGAGNAYEAEYLHQLGFSNVYVLDIAPQAIEQFKNRYPDFPANHLITEDFFEHQGQYDLILEQTFFCALNPNLREKYAHKMSELLSKKGKLCGVMFRTPMNTEHPPFGGKVEDYKNIFNKYFSSVSFEDCYNSIKPRMGNEAFVKLIK
jgi:methyl halide transferase